MDQTSSFDGLGRLTQQGGTFEGEPIARSYGYDGLGRLVSATGPWEQPQTSGSVDWTFAYDPLGNLRTLASSSGQYSRTWIYWDASRPRFLGYFREKIGAVTTFENPIQPDEGGNVALRRRSGVDTTFTWNAQNRLHKTTPGGFANHYDAFGRRDRQRVDEGATHTDLVYVGDDFEYDTQLGQGNRFFVVGGQRIASFASSFVPAAGEPWLDLEWGPPLAPPLAVGLGLFGLAGLGALALRRRPPVWIASGGIGLLGGTLVLLPLPAQAAPTQLGSHSDANGVYYLGDHLGSTRAVIDWEGTVVETRDYDPFGRVIAHTGSYQLKHRFTGQPVNETESTAASPLYNYGARFYDPRWGRFISADERAEGFDSQGLNPYAYVSNRPTSLVDPTGSFFELPVFSIPVSTSASAPVPPPCSRACNTPVVNLPGSSWVEIVLENGVETVSFHFTKGYFSTPGVSAYAAVLNPPGIPGGSIA
jgi:RHS repeat-associated protein